ncbi:electron transport complex subunit RsxC [Neptunomonas qingdaonensis]|uniref:Ion-translocating oxidoreductase complex subunit C n=1 Tax=Neptunomonas qingdaonensis TaxID=1045558 RepID=A0A1I2TJP7_9GAMM|nr:electron transport complex subunit RsxC [Neptunomonas qingdaonensis]SFG65053.1 electron transport complex protein RnfC [Neptunomonas qingdaonensis]
MSKIFAFHGGIHPPENKKQSTRSPIRPAPVPAQLTIPIQQHIGAPAKPCVKTGDYVQKGQLIAKAQGRISVSIHASSSGTVTDISPKAVPHPSGLNAPCISIQTDGKDEWIDHQGLDDYRSVPKQTLIEYIRDHGIAGMGGAGFPTDVKLHLGDDHIVNTLIINAAECEPYITADDMLIRERAEQIVGGIEIINYLLKPTHILIGIEDNKAHAIRVLEDALRHTELNIDIIVVPTKYPSGGEKQLIRLLTGVEVPSGHIPADVGIVCQNIGTAAAINQAVNYGTPLISRIVTVTGGAVSKPQNLEVLIGTPINTLLETARINHDQLSRLVMGGPMMGYTIENDSIPIIKTSNCIIAATAEEMPPAPPAQACIRCGLCEQACPAELLPQQLYWFAKSKEFEKAKHHNLFDCIECGACSYVCPSNIPLVQYYRFAKNEIRAEEAEQRKADQARLRFEARQARLEQDKVDKETRRKERAAQAAAAQAIKKTTLETAQTNPEDQIKQLKTAAAVTRTKLKKALSALEKAKAESSDDIAQLDLQYKQAEHAAEEAQTALEAAEKGALVSAATSNAPDIKQLKTQAAVARTKLKKAQQALKMAEEKGHDGVETLRATVAELETKAANAQQAFADAEASNSSSGAASQSSAMLQEAADKALQTLQKAEAALATAIENNSPAADKMQAGVEKLKSKYTEALSALQDNAKTQQPSIQQATGQQAIERKPIDLKALKQNVSIMRTKLKKAEKLLEATDENSAEASELQQEITRLTQLHQEAKAQLDAEEAIRIKAAAAQGIDLKQLKIDAALARAAATKLQRSIKKEQESEQNNLDALQAELITAQQQADKLTHTLSQFE